jgi:hypothetical protein
MIDCISYVIEDRDRHERFYSQQKVHIVNNLLKKYNIDESRVISIDTVEDFRKTIFEIWVNGEIDRDCESRKDLWQKIS